MILDFCLEPRGSSQEGFQPLLKNYYNSIRQSTRRAIGRKIRCKKSDMKSGDKVKSPKTTKLGAAFLAVCRGKVTKSNPFICVSPILQLQTHRLCNHVAHLKAPILTIKFTYDWPHVHIYSHAKIQIRFHYITTIMSCLQSNSIFTFLSINNGKMMYYDDLVRSQTMVCPTQTMSVFPCILYCLISKFFHEKLLVTS